VIVPVVVRPAEPSDAPLVGVLFRELGYEPAGSTRRSRASSARIRRASGSPKELPLDAVRVELHTRRSRESYARDFYVKNGFVEVDSALMRWEP
jgi:hypothetical protein